MNWRTRHESEPRRVRRSVSPCSFGSDAEPPLAAHLVTPRAFYTHHGIYIGGGRVVHYSGLAGGWRRGPVEEVSLAQFARGHCVDVRSSCMARFEANEVVQRARSRLGEDRYRVLSNNCEHLCEWCLHGRSRSRQVERWVALPRAAARAVMNWARDLFVDSSFGWPTRAA